MRTRITERLYRKFVHKYFARDLLFDLQMRAKRDSVDYVVAHMADAMLFRDRYALLAHALESAPKTGLVLEFGVMRGDTIRRFAAQVPSRTVHGFDTFEGLPEDWTGTFERRGKFSVGGQLPQVPGNVRLHRGLFADTLPGFAAREPEPIAFVHMDADLYSATSDVFTALGDRFVPGTVIVFDEYMNYPNWQRHEYRAFQEFVAARRLKYRYAALLTRGGQVMVVLEG